MYQIRTISTTTSSPRYDGFVECKTFADVRAHLDANPALFYGKGADILDGEDNVLFHTDHYESASSTRSWDGGERKTKPTLKACIAAASE